MLHESIGRSCVDSKGGGQLQCVQQSITMNGLILWFRLLDDQMVHPDSSFLGSRVYFSPFDFLKRGQNHPPFGLKT